MISMINSDLQQQTLGPSPGALRYPQHHIEITSATGEFSVCLGDQMIAMSDEVLCVNEAGYPEVLYFPPASVRRESLLDSDSVTTCPFKGTAAYYAAEVDGRPKDIAWYYPRTYEDVVAMKGYIAFYSDLVTIKSEIDHAR